MYISDTGPNHRIVRVRDFKDFEGDGWTTYDKALEHPLGMVATDAKKRLLITDWGNSRIVRIDDMEELEPFVFGIDGSGVNQFHHPAGITVDSKGRIYVADLGNNRIVRIDDLDATENGWTTYDNVGKEPDRQLNSPAGIVVDHSDKIYITDRGNHRVVRMDDMDGVGWTSVGGTWGSEEWQFKSPAGITVDAQGRVYVSDWGNHRVVQIDDLGTTTSGWASFGILGDGEGYFNNPAGIAVDPLKRIHVVDRGNDRVVRMDDITGVGWIELGSTPGSEVGHFDKPVGIALAVEANK
jgi:streptogramin lyase